MREMVLISNDSEIFVNGFDVISNYLRVVLKWGDTWLKNYGEFKIKFKMLHTKLYWGSRLS